MHAISVFVTQPLLMISFAHLLFGFVFPAFMGKRRGKEADERVEIVRASGLEIASAFCAGWVGSVHFSGH